MNGKKNSAARQVDKFRDLARFVIRHHFGTARARLVYQSAGLSNFVFRAHHPEGDFIVRISPDKASLNTFIKEHWAERAARSAGIPTAEILETGLSIIPFPYAVSRSVAGVPAIDHPQREKIMRELGRYAAKINKIRTHGFGETFDWSANQLSRNKTLQEYLKNEYDHEARTERLARSGLCTKATIRALRRVFREMSASNPRPTLNHGDLRLKNVIADQDSKITAIIDWEKATSNFAPPWELSLALHDLGIDRQQRFIEGYGLTAKRLADISPYIKALNLLNYIPELDRATREKDKLGLERLRIRFSGAFDLYTLT